MRVGLMIEGSTIDEVTEFVADARRRGFGSVWLTDGIGFEPLTVLGIVGRAVPDVELGTAVVRTSPRHPMALAQQALTVNAAVGGRLVLGVGPSHRQPVEEQWGLSYDRVVRNVREYLSILVPLVAQGSVDYEGDVYTAHGAFHIDAGRGLPVLLGALGEQMLRVAGARADGTVTTMTGPATLRSFTCPLLRAAADRAGRPAPRVVAMLPVVVTDDVDAARARVAAGLERMAAAPSYARAIRQEGGFPVVAGSADQVRDELASLAAAGVTDLVATRAARPGSDDDRRTASLLDAVARDDSGSAV
ncbi:MAG TPA: TIGR03564 family F420-dependent LLM class oxidoreductase [Acidimicrobiia bacterium]